MTVKRFLITLDDKGENVIRVVYSQTNTAPPLMLGMLFRGNPVRVYARDELDAWRIAQKWIEAGKPQKSMVWRRGSKL